MAFTRVWVNTIAGSELASSIDTLLSNIRGDIKERMESAFVENWAADPLVLKGSVIGKVTGKKLLIPGCAFVNPSTSHDISSGLPVVTTTYPIYGDDGSVTSLQGLDKLRAPIDLPQGVSITRVKWHVKQFDATVITCRLMKKAFALGSDETLVNIQASGGVGEAIIDSGALGLAVDSSLYWLDVDQAGTSLFAGNKFTVYGVEITYDTPDSRSTK